MQWQGKWRVLVAVALLVLAPRMAQAQFSEQQLRPQAPGGAALDGEVAIVDSSTQVLNEIMAIPASAIPKAMLSDAQGIAIVPGMIKGGFVIGIRHGRGVLLTRTDTGVWTAPSFITVTGGSIGWQAGVESMDLVLVFKTQKSIQGLTNGKLTLGAGASAAAGPVGREASISTDARLQAEIYSYSRSRGIFAGVALDGSSIQIDGNATVRFYATAGPPAAPGQPQPVPPSALTLVETVAKYAAPAMVPVEAAPGAPVAAGTAAGTPTIQETVQQLLAASAALDPLLDANWRAYLALPVELREPGANPNPAALTAVASRFDTVASDPQYRALAARPEFQRTHELLKKYQSLVAAPAPLVLPPPPPGN